MTVKVYAYVDERNKAAVQCRKDLLACEGIVEDKESPDYIVVFSGDGCFVHAHRDLHHLGVPFIGVGFGTKNFMMNRDLTNPKKLAEALLENHWEQVFSQAIVVEMYFSDKSVRSAMAFQDISFKSVKNEMLHMGIRGEKSFPRTPFNCHADGVIIANAAGSTGYNYSAGGNVLLDLEAQNWVLTAICSRIPNSFDIPFQELEIKLQRSKGNVYTDNTEHVGVEMVKIRPGNVSTEILFHPNEDFRSRRYNDLT